MIVEPESVLVRAMGSEVSIWGRGAALAVAEVERLEAILTRFKPSPLTELNQQGYLQDPPRELVAALNHALRVAELSGGLITPTVLPALEHAGYVQSFELGPTQPPSTHLPVLADWSEVRVSLDQIVLPKGTQIDLGGTAKTWIAQEAAMCLEPPFVVDAGGDIWIDQATPQTIALEHPLGGEALGLEIPAGRWGVATSSLLKRSWPGGHHLIDPRTGYPAQSPWVQATAIASEVTQAEVWSKLALLAPERLPSEAWVLVFDPEGCAHQWVGSEFIRLETGYD